MAKDDYIRFRIAKEEKKEMAVNAKRKGFEGITAFLMWLYRKFGKNGS